MDLASLGLVAVQLALKTGIAAAAGTVPVDYGFPKTLQKEHIWVLGSGSEEATYDETRDPESGYVESSGDEFEIGVRVFTQNGETFEQCVARLQELGAFVASGARSDAFAALVDDGRIVSAEIEEGRSTEGRPQAAMTVLIACRKW